MGFTFGAGIFGAIFSFAIIRPLSTRLPEALGGGYFGPKENVTAQSAATTAGIFVLSSSLSYTSLRFLPNNPYRWSI